MRILSYRPEQKIITIKAESLEDLWHLDHILEEGDIICAKTYRREEQRADIYRSQRGEKKLVKLTIKIENIEFHQHANRLRTTGVIIHGEDAGSYHTINIEEGTIFTITKEWRPYQLERLQEAVNQSQAPKILLVVMDDEQTDIGIVRQYGVEEVATIFSEIPGKRQPSQRKSAKNIYFEKVADMITKYDLPTIVAGPGFTKEEFRTYFTAHYDHPIALASVSTTGKTGLYEIVKRGLVEKVYQDSKTAQDIQLVEKLISHIVTDDAVYGIKEVEKAIQYGACETLLIADEYLRENREAEALLEKARQQGGESHIISTQHEGGEKLLNIGGIAAFLRFKIS
ncbi:MAG: mRNA surveillance protein pelota [Candidatus Methanofastidiosia archaeon]|jgi:protein pelota